MLVSQWQQPRKKKNLQVVKRYTEVGQLPQLLDSKDESLLTMVVVVELSCNLRQKIRIWKEQQLLVTNSLTTLCSRG